MYQEGFFSQSVVSMSATYIITAFQLTRWLMLLKVLLADHKYLLLVIMVDMFCKCLPGGQRSVKVLLHFVLKALIHGLWQPMIVWSTTHSSISCSLLLASYQVCSSDLHNMIVYDMDGILCRSAVNARHCLAMLYVRVFWHTTSVGQRTFAVFGPSMWNKLPAPLWSMNTKLQIFRLILKMYLFQLSNCSCTSAMLIGAAVAATLSAVPNIKLLLTYFQRTVTDGDTHDVHNAKFVPHCDAYFTSNYVTVSYSLVGVRDYRLVKLLTM